MRGFAKRQFEREAQKAREAEAWKSACARFHQGLEQAGVQLRPLFVEVQAASPSADGTYLTWWLRDAVAMKTAKVQAAIAADYITGPTLHTGDAKPGEWRTAQMWLDAQAVGDDALAAALLLTAMKATEKRPDIRQDVAIREFRDGLFRWSWDALKAVSIDPYTLSSVWFLPCMLNTDRNARDADELVDVLAKNLADFLLEWTPVRVAVRGPWDSLVSAEPC